MKRFLLVLLVIWAISVPLSADVFNLGPGLTNLEMVTVGDPGNAADTSGSGSVNYTYAIGKYEVTAGQYCDFLNHVAATDTYGLYNALMWTDNYGCKIQRSGSSGGYVYSVAADWANRPVNFVSFWDSLRFANWLNNGQPTGPQDSSSTEDGAYNINGYNGSDGHTIQRQSGSKYAVTSEDEWYKAAYYKGGGNNAGYWSFPTQSDIKPGQDTADVLGNNANYSIAGNYALGAPYYRTAVGEFENSGSAYGTFDQGGNVWERNDSIYTSGSSVYRSRRGGSFGTSWLSLDSYWGSISEGVTVESWGIGLRVAEVPDGWQPVPEPSSLLVLAGGVGMLIGLRRRRR